MQKLLFIVIFLVLVFQNKILAQKPELVVQLGHNTTIRCFDISKDGRYVFSTDANKTLKIWEVISGKLIRSILLEKEAYTLIAADNNTVWVGMSEKVVVYDITGTLLRTLKGHKEAINAMAISPDFKTIATAGWDKTIRLWSVETKLIIGSLEGHKQTVKSLVFTADGKKILSAEDGYGEKSETIIWDITKLKIEKTFTGYKKPPKWATLSSDGSKILYVAGPQWHSGSIGCIDVQTGEIIYEKPVPEGLWWIAQKKNADYFLVGGASVGIKINDVTTALYKVNIADGTILSNENSSREGIANVIRYNSDQTNCLYAVANKIKILNANTLTLVKEFGTVGEPYWNISRTIEDKILSGSAIYWDMNKNSVKLWDFQKGRLERVVDQYESYVNAVVADPRGKIMMSASDNGTIRMVGLKNLDLDGFLKINGDDNLKDVEFHPSGMFAIGVSKKGGLLVLTTEGKYALKVIEKASFSSIDFDVDGKFFVVGLYNGETQVWNFDPKNPTDMEKYKVAFKVDAEVQSFGGMTMTTSVDDVKISPDGNTLAISSGQKVKLVSLINMQTTGELLAESGTTKISFSDDGKYLAVGARSLVNVFDVDTKKLISSLVGHQSDVMGVAFSKNTRYLYSASLDTQIKVWDWQNKRELISATSIAGTEEYIFYTPEGYYLSSKGGVKALAFRVGNKMYPFEQFDLKYNRPDKVLKVLSEISYSKANVSLVQPLIEAYAAAYKKRLKKLNFAEENLTTDFHLPEAKITTPNLPTTTKKASFSFDIKVADSKYMLNRLYVSVNGVPLYGIQGKVYTKKSQTATEKISLELSQGKNFIEISVLNEKGTESLKESMEVFFEPEQPKKTTLHLITVGASEYKQSQMNLKYAAKDAQDLTTFFSSNTNDYSLKTYQLLNEKVTKENILALRKDLEKTNTDDIVMVFMSGHGLLDAELNYYLATYDTDFANPKTKALLYEELESLLDKIPARNKAIFLDACHSGELDKEEVQLATNQKIEQGELVFRNFGNTTVQQKSGVGYANSFELSKQLFADLRKGSGTTIIAASGGSEYALEGKDWKNGVFTYALLSGLREGKADANKDKKISLSEIQKYVFKTVPMLTGGKQQPTQRTENLSNDFRIR